MVLGQREDGDGGCDINCLLAWYNFQLGISIECGWKTSIMEHFNEVRLGLSKNMAETGILTV